MSDDLEILERMVGAVLATEELPSPELIREKIVQVRPATPSVTDEEAESLAKKLEHIHGVTMDIGSKLEAPGFEKWLEDAKAEIDSFFWNRYRNLLEGQSFSGQVLATLDSVTDRTLGLLENPQKDGPWDRRGMVVGHVQSGKTANYIGLISKAADAGYKVIIVIAGIHNNLRSQTQARIDEGFIGFDSSGLLNQQIAENIIGVGRHDSRRRPATFTNTLRDFNKQTATAVSVPLANLSEPVVFVIKKNTNTLKNLIEWLKEHNSRRGADSISEPMLLIDDEADNASINIKRGSDEVSRINGQIRQILAVFDRSCYVGYTATPFANIFIDPDSDEDMFGEDLFPRDFIISLDPPDNYFGASRIFLSDPDHERGQSIVRHIEDNQDYLPIKHPITHQITGLPESLVNAVRAFIIGRAIRLVRGHENVHNSMLINASRFTAIQSQLRNEVHDRIHTMMDHIRTNCSLPNEEALEDNEIAALEQTFIEEYSNAGVSWQQVKERLWDSISPISVVEVNSTSSGSLDYDGHKTGLNVIAVGGFSLSRGLTLEGLMISYFLRNSMMYDTLMQMGRWFGYRTGYEDLCRVWMPEEAEGWYAHIADSIEELRDELRRMAAVNASPKEFGLKVRSHPDALIVTARNKMGSSSRLVLSIGLANHFVETAILHRTRDKIDANRNAAIHLANSLRAAGFAPENGENIRGGKLVRNAPVSHVIDFLSAFQNHVGSPLTDTGPVRLYIEARSNDELSEWDILFPGLDTPTDKSLRDDSLGFEITCQRRGPGYRSDSDTLYITNKQRVASRGIEAVGLSEEEKKEAEESFRNEKKKRPTDSINYPDYAYRRVRQRPLLVVHLLAIGKAGKDLEGPVVAWSMSLPKTNQEEKKVEYHVNTTWFREMYNEEEDEDEAGGDDD